MSFCPVCFERSAGPGHLSLAEHLVRAAAQSDPDHIRFLNQNLTPKKEEAPAIARRLDTLLDASDGGLAAWITRRFIARFFGARPHPFVAAMQRPDRAVLLGYVLEHQHFLRQWVRSCGFVLARTDDAAVVRYEVENIATEFAGVGISGPPHYELLLRMGESLGVAREAILATPPLPRTARTLREWDRICRERHWAAAMAAMHSLELIAHRGLVARGATVPYFDPALLDSDTIPAAARAFLREGYEADVDHAETALALVAQAARDPDVAAEVQAAVLRSIELFDDYLMARLERAEAYAA